jgi:hypothetical protein
MHFVTNDRQSQHSVPFRQKLRREEIVAIKRWREALNRSRPPRVARMRGQWQ